MRETMDVWLEFCRCLTSVDSETWRGFDPLVRSAVLSLSHGDVRSAAVTQLLR
jgi:hypothetical protein